MTKEKTVKARNKAGRSLDHSGISCEEHTALKESLLSVSQIPRTISKCCAKQIPLPFKSEAVHSSRGFVSDLSLNSMPEH